MGVLASIFLLIGLGPGPEPTVQRRALCRSFLRHYFGDGVSVDVGQAAFDSVVVVG